MPFDALSAESSHAWMAEGFSEGLAAHLESAGRQVIPPAERNRALREKGLTPGAPLTRASVILLGQALGADRAVVGSYRVDEDLLEVTAKVIDLRKGAIVGVIEDHADIGEVLDLQGRVAKNLLRLEEGPVPAELARSVERRRSLSLEAYRLYVESRTAEDPAARKELLRQALVSEPDYSEARLQLGRIHLDEGEPFEAVRVLSAVPFDDPLYREAYFLLGLAYLVGDNPEGAAEVFSHLADQEDRPFLRNNLGVALLRAGRLELAREAFTRASEQAPDDPDFAFNLGWSAWRAGKGADALRWFRQAVALDPEDGESRLFRSAAAASQAEVDEAEEERTRALSLDPVLAEIDPATVTRRERIVDRWPGPQGAPASPRRAPAQSLPEDRLQRALSLREEEKSEEAIRELERILYLDPLSLPARRELAALYRETGSLDKAVGELRTVLWSSEDVETHLALAEVYAELERVEAARRHVERALELDPESARARQLLERMQAESER